jgi:putative glutamine amidotransferase
VRPLVLVTCDRRDAAVASPGRRVRPRRAEAYVNEAVVWHLRAAGARVLLAPAGLSDATDDGTGDAASLVALADAVVITGGAHDIHPRHYGHDVTGRIDRVDDARVGLELALARACARVDVPVLGLCGGMQALAVALGGTLVQDIRTSDPRALDHEQPTDPAQPSHPIEAWGPLAALVGPAVNSTHHQAIDATGPLSVFARAPDGVIEAVQLPDHPFAVGVQWHPEILGLDPATGATGPDADPRLFCALVAAAARRAADRRALSGPLAPSSR